MRPKVTFKSLNLNQLGRDKADVITAIFEEALSALEPLFDDPRCAAIVRTKLEEACFFSKKSLALAPAHQEHPDAD